MRLAGGGAAGSDGAGSGGADGPANHAEGTPSRANSATCRSGGGWAPSGVCAWGVRREGAVGERGGGETCVSTRFRCIPIVTPASLRSSSPASFRSEPVTGTARRASAYLPSSSLRSSAATSSADSDGSERPAAAAAVARAPGR